MKGKAERGLYRPKFKDRKTGKIKQIETWWISFTCRGCAKHPHGGLHRESAGTDNKTEARRKLDQRRGNAADGKPTTDINEITLRKLLTDVENDYLAKGKRSIHDVKDRIKNHILAEHSPLLSQRALSLCYDQSILRSYVSWRKEQGAANASVNYELSLIRRGFSLNKNQISVLPIFPMLKVDNARKVFFSEEEYTLLCNNLPDDVRRPIQVAWLTGWRMPSEILTREKQHVHIGAGKIILEPGETKNGKGRFFPLIPELLEVIREQLAATAVVERKSGHLISSLFHHDGVPLVYRTKRGAAKTSTYFRETFKAGLQASGLSGRICHDFRRSAARDFRHRGVDTQVAMKLLGHLTESIYHRYDIITDEEVFAEAQKLTGSAKSVQSKGKAK